MSCPRVRTDRLRTSWHEDGGLDVYDELRDSGHVLNPVAAQVYALADGTRTVPEVAAELTARLAVPADGDLVLLALAELDRAELLACDGEVLAHRLPGRRAVLRSVAGVVALLPLVMSVANLHDHAWAAQGTGHRDEVVSTEEETTIAPVSAEPMGAVLRAQQSGVPHRSL